jgi:hypothetical protein
MIINAHKPASVAAFIWADEYAAQRGSVMDFWDGLSLGRRSLARAYVEVIENSRAETYDELQSAYRRCFQAVLP